jgi:hypothetical protein
MQTWTKGGWQYTDREQQVAVGYVARTRDLLFVRMGAVVAVFRGNKIVMKNEERAASVTLTALAVVTL